MTEHHTVGVVGAGVMGRGVAEVAAAAGHRVILVDVDDAILGAARSAIRRSLWGRALTGGGPRPDLNAVLGRIETTMDLDRLSAASFVIENATERVAVKEPIYRRLDGVCPPDTVLAANTSAIPVAHIAGWTGRPDRVLGMHFMNPVPLKQTIEVVRGEATGEETLARAEHLLESMGMRGIVVGDRAGFVSNRVLMLTVNEAAGVVEAGVAPADDVDRVFVECFGHRMGPLATADLIGLDTIVLSLEVLRDFTGEERFEPVGLLRELVGRGDVGRKSGAGFFPYR
jgi:3-hydroxybutyryl-CoA dehydrogenase